MIPKKEIDALLEPVLAAFSHNLQYRLNGWMVTAYLRGSSQMTSYGHTMGLQPILFEGPPMQQAIDYANKYGAEAVKLIDRKTKDVLAQIISDGIENKRGVNGIARDLRVQFEKWQRGDEMTPARSQLIAKTETHRALTQGSQDRMEAMGVTGKQWILGSGGKEGNCDDCRANAAVGVIPVNDEFPTPQDEIHPQCTCAISPAMIEEQ